MEDPRDDEVYPEQENQADQGPERLTVKALPKVITVITSVITSVTTTKSNDDIIGTAAIRVVTTVKVACK